SSSSSFSLLNILLGLITLMALIVSLIFIVLFISSNNAKKEVENELERLKNNEPMSCAWMAQCKRKRSGAPPLLVISMDGFANRYINRLSTPTIKKLGECGGHAEFMYPSFPSKTFPNHYSIATGLYPGAHGIIDNSFYTPKGIKYNSENGSFYRGEPIWNTVVKNGKKSKTFMWLGSYDKIQGVEATFHQTGYNKNVEFIKKIDNVTDWLISDDPPALSMLYLEEPDWIGHAHGPDSDKTREKTSNMDGFISYILRKFSEAGVLGCTNIIILSDHGMRNISRRQNLQSIDPEYSKVLTSIANNILFYGHISTESLKCNHGSDYRVYRSKEEVPLRFHYGHENIGFPYVLGNPGVMFDRNESEFAAAIKKNNHGNHGWDNMDTDMQTIFYAVGPSIRSNITLAPFQNIQLYNLFADLMNIPAVPNNGTTGLLDDLLVKPPNRKNEFEKYNVKSCEKVSFESCDGSNQMISLYKTTGYLHSKEESVCSIHTGRLSLLYSRRFNRTVGMEIFVKKRGSYQGEVVTRMNNQLIGDYCGEGRAKSLITNLVPESSLKLTWANFTSLSLVEKAIDKLAMKKNTRIQIGFVYESDGSIKSMFVSGFWCDGDGWRKEGDYCKKEGDTKTESYAIPAPAIDNFNCLDDETLLFDYRTSITDIENETGLSLLPKSMPLSMRRRISLFLLTEIFV
ncbi:hypothetical protein PENTCL1PPCAC_2040, partial [Pristionchus entomophagus]